MFDGIIDIVGGAASGTMFYTYHPYFLDRRATASPLTMSGDWVLAGNQVTLTLDLGVDLPVTTTDNRLHIFVCQEGLHSQSNMVVDILASEPVTLTTPGQTAVVTRTFTFDPAWLEEDLRIIALVQSQDSKEILQAVQAIPDYKATVVIDSTPDGVEAPWLLQGPGGLERTGAGDRTLKFFFAGDYTLTWLEVPRWTSPAVNPQVLTAAEYGTITFAGEYTDGPFTLLVDGPIGDPGSGQGVGLTDFDGDGDLDVHVVNDGTADQLLRNDGGGVFSDVAAGAIADAGPGRGCAWADFSGDGVPDVYVGRRGQPDLLLIGDGAGGFTPANAIGAGDAGSATSVSWADYDLDGILDLYVVRASQTNLLLRSLGDVGGGLFIFTGITSAANDVGNGSAACWGDANLDGRLDLYLSNRFTVNRLYENLSNGLSDVTSGSGTGDQMNGTGAAWGDFDNDGDLDLYLANENAADRLFRNTGTFQFSQVLSPNLGDQGAGRGVVWADFDNDTHLDLYVTRHDQPDLLLLGDGTGQFERVPVGPAEADLGSNAVACGDLDGDGDLDLFITREGQTNVLLRNGLSDGNGWFQVRLTGVTDQSQGLGARVTVTAGGVTQTRLVTSGSGFLSSGALDAAFGLGAAQTVDQVTIHWPRGGTQTAGPFPANRLLYVTQGVDPVSGVGDAAPATVSRLGRARPNPFNPNTTIEFSLARSGPVRLEVFALDGRRVRTLVAGDRPAGLQRAEWNGTDDGGRPAASGTYLYRLAVPGEAAQSGRMTLVK